MVGMGLSPWVVLTSHAPGQPQGNDPARDCTRLVGFDRPPPDLRGFDGPPAPAVKLGVRAVKFWPNNAPVRGKAAWVASLRTVWGPHHASLQAACHGQEAHLAHECRRTFRRVH
ncbi:hypothetical protein RA210_U180005 [Rubrivivax sp. A210]|nr:hypothetical protein RA210_U180005 [Rubrivivax sp. A210]